jgi:hypothetical protein
MRITTITKPIADLLRYYGYYRKVRRLLSDWERMKAEWIRIGGFKASTEPLLGFLNEFSQLLVEYATWTPTALDDQIAGMIRTLLTDYRDILEMMIERVRIGEEMSVPELSAIVETIGLASGESGSPMTILYILSIVYRVLQCLRLLDTVPPTPDKELPILPPEPKRPIIDFIRKIFGRETGVGHSIPLDSTF